MSGPAPKAAVYPGHPAWRGCSATIWLDQANEEIHCDLQHGHESEHEHSGLTEFNKCWTLQWRDPQ